MADIDDGGPAFPNETFTASASGGGHRHLHGGMSLRDWFAGQAMTAIIPLVAGGVLVPKRSSTEIDKDMARQAYHFADAMLAARKEGA